MCPSTCFWPSWSGWQTSMATLGGSRCEEGGSWSRQPAWQAWGRARCHPKLAHIWAPWPRPFPLPAARVGDVQLVAPAVHQVGRCAASAELMNYPALAALFRYLVLPNAPCAFRLRRECRTEPPALHLQAGQGRAGACCRRCGSEGGSSSPGRAAGVRRRRLLRRRRRACRWGRRCSERWRRCRQQPQEPRRQARDKQDKLGAWAAPLLPQFLQ